MLVATVDRGASFACGDGAVVPWWSVTKTVIAAAILRLVQERRLDLDAALPTAPYTLPHLLQHRAGLADYGMLRAYHEAVARHDAPWPVATLLTQSDAARLRYEPGDGWGYSNIGYLYLRRIIEHRMDAPLGEALEKLVLQPCGITDAHLANTSADLMPAGDGVMAGYHPGWVYHGLLVGPLGDVALLLHRLMTGSLLDPALLQQMQTGHILGAAMPDRPWVEPGYGLGLMCGKAGTGLAVTGHSGGGPQSVIAVYHTPATGRTAAAFAPGEDMAAVETAVFQAIAGRE